MIVAFISAAIGWFAWDFRTRSTTLRLIDAKSGKPITTQPSAVAPDDYGPGFEFSQKTVRPGEVRLTWNHRCILHVRVDGYVDEDGDVFLDGPVPDVVELRLSAVK
jgi:hypothetical protein